MNKVLLKKLSLGALLFSSLTQAIPAVPESITLTEKLATASAASSSFIAQKSAALLSTLDKALFSGLSKLKFAVAVNPGTLYRFAQESPYKSVTLLATAWYIYYRYTSSIPYAKKLLMRELKGSKAAGWNNQANAEKHARKIGGQKLVDLIKEHNYSLTDEVEDRLLQPDFLSAAAIWRGWF